MRFGKTTWTVRDIGIDRNSDGEHAEYILTIGTTIFTLAGRRAWVRARCATLLRQDRRGERAF